jgi:hypothetical protein
MIALGISSSETSHKLNFLYNSQKKEAKQHYCYKREDSKATYPSQTVTENLEQDIHQGMIDIVSATDE